MVYVCFRLYNNRVFFHPINFQFHINIYEKEISLAFNEMHYKKMSVDVSMLVVYWNEVYFMCEESPVIIGKEYSNGKSFEYD